MPPVGEALEYITQVLSQRGPQAVPYPEATKWNIREHLSELLKVSVLHITATETCQAERSCTKSLRTYKNDH